MQHRHILQLGIFFLLLTIHTQHASSVDLLRQNPVEFYGKAIDQHGEPVRDSSIIVSVSSSSGAKIVELRTDSKGLFSIEKGRSLRGDILFVRSITKTGYDFDLAANVGNLSHSFNPEVRTPHIPDKNKPIVFVLRRKSDSMSYMTDWGHASIVLRYPDDSVDVDLVGQYIDRKGKKRWGRNGIHDLNISISNSNKDSWRLSLAVLGDSSGIEASSNLLSSSPEIRNHKTHVLESEIGSLIGKPLYIYTRTRKPAIYSIIQIKGVSIADSFIRLTMSVRVNPYGDTILEPNTSLPVSLRAKLEKEARAALQEGRLPLRSTDIQKRIERAGQKEAKEQELLKTYSEDIYSKQIRLNINTSPKAQITSPVVWEATYHSKSGTRESRTTQTLVLRHTNIFDVKELGGELLLAFVSENDTNPWVYIRHVKKRDFNLPRDATLELNPQSRVPIVIQCKGPLDVQDQLSVGLFFDKDARLPIYRFNLVQPADRSPTLQAASGKVVPGHYVVRGIDTKGNILNILGEIDVTSDTDAVFVLDAKMGR